MCKFLIVAGLLTAATFVPGAPAQAAMGCQCVKFGAPSVCTATVSECNQKIHGLCLAPCSYHPPQKMVKRRAHMTPKKKQM